MTDASAMILTLLVSGALLASAVFIILWGGGLSLWRHEAKPRRRHQHPEHRKAA